MSYEHSPSERGLDVIKSHSMFLYLTLSFSLCRLSLTISRITHHTHTAELRGENLPKNQSLNVLAMCLQLNSRMGLSLTIAGSQDSDFFQEAIKIALRSILNVILHLSGFKL